MIECIREELERQRSNIEYFLQQEALDKVEQAERRLEEAEENYLYALEAEKEREEEQKKRATVEQALEVAVYPPLRRVLEGVLHSMPFARRRYFTNGQPEDHLRNIEKRKEELQAVKNEIKEAREELDVINLILDDEDT